MSDPMRFRLSRRQFVVGSVLATGVSLLAACAPAAPQAPVARVVPKPASTPAPAAAGGAIKRGGTLIHSTFTTYTTMDPHLNASFLNPGYDALYNGLVRFELVDPKTGKHKVV